MTNAIANELQPDYVQLSCILTRAIRHVAVVLTLQSSVEQISGNFRIVRKLMEITGYFTEQFSRKLMEISGNFRKLFFPTLSRVSKWTDEYLTKNFGDEPVQAEVRKVEDRDGPRKDMPLRK